MTPEMLKTVIQNNIKASQEITSQNPGLPVCFLQYTEQNFSRNFYHMEFAEYKTLLEQVSKALLEAGRQVCLVDSNPEQYKKWLKEKNLTDSQQTRSAFASGLGKGPEI